MNFLHYIYCIPFVLLLSFEATCQNDEAELIQQLSQCESDSCRIDAYNLLAWNLRKYDYSRAKQYVKKSIELCKRHNYLNRQATAYNRLGIILKNEEKLDSAIYYYNEALKIEKKQKHSFGIGRAYYQLSKAYKIKGNFAKALEYAKLNLRYMRLYGEDKDLANSLTNLGIIHSNLDEYVEAIKYYFEALEKYEKVNSLSGQANINQDLGNLYEKMMDYDLAKKHHELAFQFYTDDEDYFGISDQYVNLGNVFFEKEDFDQAEAFYHLAFDLKTELGDQSGIRGCLHNFSMLLENKGEFSKAIEMQRNVLNEIREEGEIEDSIGYFKIQYSLGVNFLALEMMDSAVVHLKIAYDLAKIMNQPLNILLVCESLSLAYSGLRQFAKALAFRQEASDYQEQLHEEYRNVSHYRTEMVRVQNENNLMRHKAKAERAELKEVQLLAQNRNIWMYAIAFLALGLAAYIFFWKRNVKERQALKIRAQEAEIKQSTFEDKLKQSELAYRSNVIEAQEEERHRISEELHDNLGGMLSTIKLHFKVIEDEIQTLPEAIVKAYKTTTKLLDKATEKVRVMSHEMSSMELEKFGLLAELRELTDTITSSGRMIVKLNAHNVKDRFAIEFETGVYKTIRELITNVLKHGDASLIQVGLTRYNGELNVMVEDNGKGFDPKNMTPGLGFTQISERLKKFGGKMNIDSGKGSGTTISIDIGVKAYIK